MRRSWWSLALLVLAVARCDNAGAGRVLAIGASGIVKGVVYLDRNGNRQQDAADTALQLVRVRLFAMGTLDTTVSLLSDSAGRFRMPAVPIGSYAVGIDTITFGDSVRLVQLSATQVSVEPGDSVTITATVSFPVISVRAARLLPAGRKVFVQGVLLSPRQAFGDTTGHLADTSQAIRLTRMRANVIAVIGDSLRALGVTAMRDGQATLDDVALIPLGVSGGAAPAVTTAGAAWTAQNGALDAALVFISGAVIADTARVVGTGSPSLQDFQLIVDDPPPDGFGRLEVLLDGNAGFTGNALLGLRPNVVIDVTGVLVPSPSVPGVWRLKPRAPGDVILR